MTARQTQSGGARQLKIDFSPVIELAPRIDPRPPLE
jgi:hypothetical protein